MRIPLLQGPPAGRGCRNIRFHQGPATMRKSRYGMLLLLLTALVAVGYANFPAHNLREFEFRIRSDDAEESSGRWILTKSSGAHQMIDLYFHLKMGRKYGRGNSIPVVVRQLDDGCFDLVRESSTRNTQTWKFDDGSSVRLFWTCEPIDKSVTKVHAAAVEYRHDQPVKALSQTITLTLSSPDL